MCGICGVLNFQKDKHVDPGVIKRMASAMVHRGPDEDGTFVEKNIGLGARRLSIIDVSGGRQPIENEDGSMVIVFNGMIYNYKDLKRDLELRGHIFKTKTDTEVILHSFEEHGIDCLNDLRGMFAFAIWDRRSKDIFIARDRLGIKPLYYSIDKEKLVFASELKPILATGYIKREVRLSAIDEYLSLRYILEPNTIFKNIFVLPGGNFIKCRDGNILMRKYWDLNFESEENLLSEADYIEKVKHLLNESIGLHLISDVDVGAYLSGGIDSSSVVSLMQRKVSRPVRTFSVGYPDEDEKYSELSFAKLVSKFLGTKHNEVLMNAGDFDNLIPKYIWYQEQPLADASLLPYYFISEQAKKHVKVMLSGVGGDEFFFGYSDLRLATINNQINRKLFNNFGFKENIVKLYSCGKGKGSRMRGLGRLLLFPPHSYMPIRYFEGNQKRNIYSEKFLKEAGLNHTDLEIKALLENAPKKCSAYQQTLYVYIKTWLATNMLQGTDKATMASSIEQRVPLLDHKLIEFLSCIPQHILLKGGKYKHVFREAMRGLLPESILDRKKMGFQTPEIPWYRKHLKDKIKSTLLSKKSLGRGYFRPRGVRDLMDAFEGKDDRNLRRIWLLYNLELWHNIFIDKDLSY